MRGDYMHILRSSYKAAMEAACDTALIQVVGPKGSGKTTLVLDAMKSKNHVFYFSFESLSAQEALRLFSKCLSDFLRVESSTDWESAFASIKRAYEIDDPIIILDHFDDSAAYGSLHDTLLDYLLNAKRQKGQIVVVGEHPLFSENEVPSKVIRIEYFTFEETAQRLPQMPLPDALLVHGATGGIPELCALFEPYDSFFHATKNVLIHSSRYIRFVPDYMNSKLRTVTTYNAILHTIATGANRISLISATLSEPKNKCDIYCRVLIELGIITKKETRYLFTNNYFKIWYALFYDNPLGLYYPERDFTLNTEFNKYCGSYAFQRFRSMALMHAQKNEHLHYLTTIGSKNMSSFARKVQLPNGEEYYFDAVVCEDDHFLFVKVFSDSETNTGIPSFEKMDFAASQIAPLYKSNYIVYSVRPFKQRVKQYVSKLDYLKVYCLEQLK